MMRTRVGGGVLDGRLREMPPLELNGPISEPLPCPKRRFESEREALTAPRPPMAPPLFAYRCNLCRGWHRTEQRHRRKGRR